MALVSIIIPSRNRSHLLLERLRVLEKNTPELFNGIVDVIMSIDEDDEATYGTITKNFPEFIIHLNKTLEIPCVKWNNSAAKCPKTKWFVTMSDDSIPHPNWLTNALNMITDGFIGLPDGVTGERNKNFTPLYMATREWLQKYNGGVLVIPKYKSWYADVETAVRAHRSGTYRVGNFSVVEQLHEVFGTAPKDEMYELGASRRVDDYKMYAARLVSGFPDDFESVL